MKNTNTSSGEFILNKRTRTLHLSGCSSLNKVKEDNLEKVTMDIDGIQDSDYHFCKNCSKNISQVSSLSLDEQQFLEIIKKDPVPLPVICEKMNKSSNDLFKLVDSLREKGYEAVIKREELSSGKAVYQAQLAREIKKKKTIRLKGISRKEIKILIVSDTGFGLKTHQPELYATAIEMAKKQKVDFAIHAGNITAGKMTPSTIMDFETESAIKQLDYFTRKMPQTPFKMYFLNGPKDLEHIKKGVNPAQFLGNSRSDFRYAGDLRADFFVKNLKITVTHVKDRVTYTKSYMLQGLAENLREQLSYVYRQNRKPNLLLVGGNNTYLYLPTKKKNGMEAIGLPSLYAMTPSQEARKKRGGSSELGYIIVTVKMDDQGNPKEIEHQWYPLTAYQRDPYAVNESEAFTQNSNLTDDQRTILEMLRQRPRRYGEISREIGKSKSYLQQIVGEMRKKGYYIPWDGSSGTISLMRDWRSREFKPISMKEMFVKNLKLGNFSDTHIGNRKFREDLLPKVYQICEKNKVDAITHSGDVLDGMAAYRGHELELLEHGADEQEEKAKKIWPKSKIKTYVITGSSHEWVYWDRAGHNPVKSLAKEIPNMEYIGGRVGLEGHLKKNGVIVKLVHPKGGVPYGKSYRLQKFIEALTEEVDEASSGANLILVGHLHLSMAMLYKGVAAFLVPCLEEQTWYLKGKQLNPWLGMWITEISLDKRGNITRLFPKYVSFEKEPK